MRFSRPGYCGYTHLILLQTQSRMLRTRDYQCRANTNTLSTHISSNIRHLSLLVRFERSLEASLQVCHPSVSADRKQAWIAQRTSGCLSRPAACEPTLALSIFAVTTSKRSIALSIPVAEYSSGALGGSSLPASAAARPPPAAIAPGPAGLTTFPFLAAPAFGAALTLAGCDASSSARRRAFSAFRASSARRLASLSSLPLAVFAPSCHLSASLRS